MQLLLRDTRKKFASFPCSCMKFRVRIIKQRSFSKKTGARKQLRMWVNKLRVCSRMIGTEPTQNKRVKVISLAFSLFPSTCKWFQTKYISTDLKKLQDELVTYFWPVLKFTDIQWWNTIYLLKNEAKTEVSTLILKLSLVSQGPTGGTLK